MAGGAMSLLRKLERRDYTGGFLSNPWGPPNYQIPTNGQLAFLDGGVPLSTEIALKHWPVWACIRVIADVISTLPIDVFTGDEPLDPTPTRITSPSPYASSLQWRWQVAASLLSRGNAYGLISATDRLGYPTQVDLLSPEHVRVEMNANGRKVFKIENRTLTSAEVWHLPGPQLPGQLEGLAPVQYAARTIGLGIDAEKFGGDYFRNGIHPTAVLETDQLVNQDQAQTLKQRLKEATRNREVAVLGAGTKLNSWQLTATESQFLETQHATAGAIAQIFGVPSEMIGVAMGGRSSLTYANREQRAQDFLNSAINPWLARLEESLSAWFPRGTYVKFNTGGLLRADLSARYAAHRTGILSGFLAPNEARKFENLPPYPGGDEFHPPQVGGGSTQGDGTEAQPPPPA